MEQQTARRVRGRRRIARNDQTKAALKALIDQAARDLAAEHGEEAAILAELAAKVEGCRGGSAFRDGACGAYLVRPHSCHCRLCPDCERARTARQVARFDELATAMTHPFFLTLTVPNVTRGELEAGVDVLLDALAHLRRRAIFRGGPCAAGHRAVAFDEIATGRHHESGDELAACSHPRHRRELAAAGQCRCARCIEVAVTSDGYRVTLTGCPRCTHQAVRGGVYSLEITWRDERGEWHPHAHLLVDGPFILWAELRDAWRAVTCDAIRRAERRRQGIAGRLPACPHHVDEHGGATDGCRGAWMVWIEGVKGEPGSPERRAAIRETLKYVSKGLLSEDSKPLKGAGPLEVGELLLALRGRRLVAGWGSLRNVHDAEDDDELDPADHFVGPDVLPSLQGLPRRCPMCGGEALWELPIDVPRLACLPGAKGFLVWRPLRDARA